MFRSTIILFRPSNRNFSSSDLLLRGLLNREYIFANANYF
jgi:hypothetical protein